MTAGVGMLVFFHLSPWAVEPPADVILPYANPVVGYLAFGLLLALIAVTAVGAAYTLLLWRRGTRPADEAA
jgi:energy-converting hydrogenase Eha subunit E